MITSPLNQLEGVLRQDQPQSCAESIIEFYRSCNSNQEFIEQAGAYIATTLYQDDYSGSAPRSFMSFVGAVQLGRFVHPDRHIGPLAQALWCYAREETQDPRMGLAGSRETWMNDSPLNEIDLSKLDELYHGNNFDSFFTNIIETLYDEEQREDVLGWILKTAIEDQFNVGHKFLYLAKSIAFVEYLGWQTPEVYLFPPLHYLFNAPQDRKAEELLQERLDHHQLELSDQSFDTYELSNDQTHQIRDAILYESSEEVLDTLLGAFDYGVAPPVLAEALLVTSAQFILSVPYDRWVIPVHSFNYTEAVWSNLGYLRSVDQQRMILMNGLFLKQVAEVARPLELREPFFTARPEFSPIVPSDLEEAIDLSIPTDAMATLDWLYHRGQLSAELFERLVLTTAKTDGDRHFGQDLMLAYAVLEAYHSSSSSLREFYLLALVKFLAESEKSRTMDHSLAMALHA